MPGRPPTRARRRHGALLTTLVAVAASLAASAGVSAASPPHSSTREVAYRGYHVRVPADWPVVDLTRKPGRCARFDKRVVYLGHPSGQASCPSGLVGRTTAVLIQPLTDPAATEDDPTTATAPTGTARYPDGTPHPDGEIRLAVPGAGVLVTASYGEDSAPAEHILATGRLDKKRAHPAPARGPRSSPPERRGGGAVPAQPGTYKGKGFDACAAPGLDAMDAWQSSPYRAVGVYIGGNNRACAQPELTPSWVSEVTAEGWHLMPIHVGYQAPCTRFRNRMSYAPDKARAQGREAADDAADRAGALGIPAGSVLYNDMEHYDTGDYSCREPVLAFLAAWTDELHELGYRSGVYSGASSGISALAEEHTASEGTYSAPDHVWFALWNGQADTDAGWYLPDSVWNRHQRIHQYQGNVRETHGGVTIGIDRNYLDCA